MSRATVRRIRALALAVGLAGWGLAVKPRMSGPGRPLVQAALSTALVLTTRSPLGLRPPALWSGVRLGVSASALVAATAAAGTALPTVRTAIAGRPLPERTLQWLLLRIPIGTAWSEEVAFRAALANVATDAFGPTGGRLLQAATFGLWHIADARSTGASVPGTVLATGVGGWFFGWLHERSGSLAAPLLVHLTVNEAGAVAALAPGGAPFTR